MDGRLVGGGEARAKWGSSCELVGWVGELVDLSHEIAPNSWTIRGESDGKMPVASRHTVALSLRSFTLIDNMDHEHEVNDDEQDEGRRGRRGREDVLLAGANFKMGVG